MKSDVADTVIEGTMRRGFIPDALKQIVTQVRTGGIRRRLLMWGLGLFGISLLIVVVACYSYFVSQIKTDAGELQSEIASVTADRIRVFVQRKIERFSDA